MVDACCSVTGLWQDGSVRWLDIEGTLSVGANAQEEIFISEAKPQLTPLICPVTQSDSSWEIKLDSGDCISIDPNSFLRLEVSAGIRLDSELTTQAGLAEVRLISSQYETRQNGHRTVAVKLFQQASAITGGKPVLLQAEITIMLSTGDLFATVTVSNPSAAAHPDGKWDLGDPNSILIEQWSLSAEAPALAISLDTSETPIKLEADTDYCLYQASSGYDNWQSPAHVDKSNQVSLPFRGFRWHINNQLQRCKDHCQPAVTLISNRHSPVLSVDQFWQNFPASVSGNGQKMQISLLGSRQAPLTELQPGEQKTRDFSLTGQYQTPLKIVLNPQWTEQSKAVCWFHAQQHSAPLHALIQQGVSGEHSFFAKRLDIDEFGWRHFGELYADHEKALQPDETYFISHYNNQYDPLYGMLYQYLLTGKRQWFTLANDLARHVADIDVYHTCQDKPEYSGGLFWHTDHYVQAHTATHRTYSEHQPKGVYDDHAGGGGPGGQHCYTNGLLLHYYLTGSATSKQALLSICDWIERYYEGDGTLVATLMGLKNRHVPGLRNILTGAYPLDRGTGNYLQALMDRYALLGQPGDLAKCAHIIYNTIQPDEDIQKRQLDNIEANWFYTVFLQAVCRFISIKEQNQRNDSSYRYAVDALCHYARWMSENEYAYLDKPDILEFPNQTWSGQDLRKICVLRFASHYLPEAEASKAEAKAKTLLETVQKRLGGSGESTTTRVLCLMMQNYVWMGYQHTPAPMPLKDSYPEDDALYRPALRQVLARTLRNFSLHHERRQLSRRFPQLPAWVGKS
ncbi:hypothetical protein [Alteromonas aestuariivivens]|uniref:hypothetical protein n=1 Tax=Alteromonas aestuariivivens TaxID=1938339 RepID=UPI0011C07631|nr:hypothetical protein [Alteromonas aestuariivivens]